MRAVRLTGWQAEPEIRDVPVPGVGAGEVLVKVAGAGVCHSDLHLMEWPPGALPYELPFTLGHENAGWVEAVGPGVSGVREGDAVIVYGPWGCGACRRCAMGEENYCERSGEIKAAGGGLGRDGGMAEYMLVPSARFLVPIGDLDPRTAAPLADAGLTAYHAVKRSLSRLTPGSTAVVIGAGGLGHTAIELLRALSPATVVAVDVAADKLELARQAGAHHTVTSDEEAATRIRDLTHGQGAALVLDFVGGEGTLRTAAGSAAVLGEVTIVGLAGGTLPVGYGAVPLECSVCFTYWGSRPELMEVVALAREGRITVRTEAFPLDQARDVYRRLREGKLAGRGVLLPHG